MGAPSQSVCASSGWVGTARSRVILPSWVQLSIQGIFVLLRLFIMCIASEYFFYVKTMYNHLPMGFALSVPRHSTHIGKGAGL